MSVWNQKLNVAAIAFALATPFLGSKDQQEPPANTAVSANADCPKPSASSVAIPVAQASAPTNAPACP